MPLALVYGEKFLRGVNPLGPTYKFWDRAHCPYGVTMFVSHL